MAELHGGLDIIVSNAGVTDEAPLTDIDAAGFERMIHINTMSVLFSLKHAKAHMNASGSIINTSSMAGRIGFPAYGSYAASKAAVISLTQVAAIEYGPLGIRVNAICPGSVDTPMLAAQPGGGMESAVARLASPLGQYRHCRSRGGTHALPGRRRLPGHLRTGADHRRRGDRRIQHRRRNGNGQCRRRS